ncbi:MAG: protein-L-isoaspartate(D-aspartate) O-methyltransferase [Dehalococcoidia bacterium]|nr:protein-L-isoaspartate(D-aspartate) O-methyltransferase [Dehalococcoidia bacterium]
MDLETARARLLKHLSWEIADECVVEAMSRVRREAFVPAEYSPAAYDDRPLCIGFGQTISQPFIVALMIQALELQGEEKVLELGTGSGYEAAVLANIARRVVTVEVIPELKESAVRVLEKLGYANVEVHAAGQTLGWLEDAPYDAIIVSAGAPSIPQILLGQLAWGGRMVIPVGSRWQQDLMKITKKEQGNEVENLGACYFVPLVGEGAWKE